MPLATHWGDGAGGWHPVAARVQSNELWGESAIERRECLAALGFDDPARSLRFDSDEVWSVDCGWTAPEVAREPGAPVFSQEVYDALHPVGCERFSEDGNLAPAGVVADWQAIGGGMWRRVS